MWAFAWASSIKERGRILSKKSGKRKVKVREVQRVMIGGLNRKSEVTMRNNEKLGKKERK